MKRKERHELKQNELLIMLEQLATWSAENRRFLKSGLVVGVLAAAAGAGLYIYQHGRSQAAEALLAEGMRKYHGVIRENTIVAAAEEGTMFDSVEERYRAALETFQSVAQQYGSLAQAREARYYAALCQVGLGAIDDAQALLEEVVRKRGDLLYSVASQTLATVKSQKGDYTGAADIYRAMVDDPQDPLPKDQLLFSMAQQLEKGDRLEEARQAYQRFLDEYPQSLLRAEAEQRSELLELRLNPPSA
ncbi:MAG: tetratricopeptide repeat protein [Vicinamibacteria bacterium]